MACAWSGAIGRPCDVAARDPVGQGRVYHLRCNVGERSCQPAVACAAANGIRHAPHRPFWSLRESRCCRSLRSCPPSPPEWLAVQDPGASRTGLDRRIQTGADLQTSVCRRSRTEGTALSSSILQRRCVVGRGRPTLSLISAAVRGRFASMTSSRMRKTRRNEVPLSRLGVSSVIQHVVRWFVRAYSPRAKA